MDVTGAQSGGSCGSPSFGTLAMWFARANLLRHRAPPRGLTIGNLGNQRKSSGVKPELYRQVNALNRVINLTPSDSGGRFSRSYRLPP
jgi:hypothetical protein